LILSDEDTLTGIAIKGLSAASLPNDLTADQARWAKDMIKYLDDASAPPAEVRLCLDALDEHGLKLFNYPYYYLNLLSAVGDYKSPAHVRDLAIACVKFRLWRQWQSHADAIDLHAKKIAGERLPVRLKGWDKQYLDSILGNGGGMIVCTCHYGASCYILDDLTTFGYDIVIGLDANSAFGFRKRLELLGHMSASGEKAVPVGNGSVRIVDVENNGFAAVALAKALRKNQVVLLYFDGNSGMNGAQGNSNKCALECFGYPVQVKSGVAQLAISTKAPLVPVFSLQTHSVLDPSQPSERGVVHVSQPIAPEAGQDKESFAQHTLQFLFRRLEGLVSENPEQWEGACLFHRWRVTPARAAERKPDLNAMNALAEGRRLRINDRLIATIPSSDGFMLVNVRTLRVFKGKRKHDWVLSTLATEGVNKNMLHARWDDYPEALGCIKDLSELGFIEHCD
jgi:hypothetical protein